MVTLAAVSIVLFLLAGSPMVKRKLNTNLMKDLSARFVQVVDGYFSPPLEFVSAASLWARIGKIDSLGDPEMYVDSLYRDLNSMKSVSVFSMVDKNGRELVLKLKDNDSFEWFETDIKSSDSFYALRKKTDTTFLNLGDVSDISTSWGKTPVWYQISRPYILPQSNQPGITIKAKIGDSSSDYSLTLWLDMPVSAMNNWLKPVEDFPDAVVFMLLPGNEFLMFSVQELLALSKNGSTEMDFSNPGSEVDKNIVVEALRTTRDIGESETFDTTFEYMNRLWRADFRNYTMGTQEFLLGTFIPVESLWVSDIFFPVQLAVSIIFIFTLLMSALIIWDFKRNASAPGEAEQLKKLIAKGESSTLEFKSSLRWDYHTEKTNKALENVILKSIAAFSNADGGKLLIGVKDNGEILGLEPDYKSLKDYGRDYFELHLRNLVVSNYGLTFATDNINIKFLSAENKDVCIVEIKKGRYPVFTKVSSKGASPFEKFYIRSGNSSRSLDNVGEAAEYIIKRFGRKIYT